MKKNKIKKTLFLLAPFSLMAQTMKINKIIVDRETRIPIENISIYNDKDNSISSKEGIFVFVSDKNEINFSGIGYNGLKSTFDLIRNQDTIFMERKAIALDEIVISDAGLFMKKVYNNITSNYSSGPYSENFYLRCLLKKNEAIVRLQDISGRVYRERLFRTKEKNNSAYSVEVVNMRKLGISETKDIEYFQFQNFKQTFNMASSILLNLYEKYSFTEVTSTDPDYRKINFIEKEKNERGQNSNGYFIINKSDLAIKEVFMDNYTAINGIPYQKKGAYKWRTTFFQSLVQYAQNNENKKYYISNAAIKGNVEFLKDNSEKTIYDFTTDLFITKSFITEKVKSNFSVDKDIFKAKFSYSEDFWKTQNQLPLTSELKVFLKNTSEDKRTAKEFDVIGNF